MVGKAFEEVSLGHHYSVVSFSCVLSKKNHFDFIRTEEFFYVVPSMKFCEKMLHFVKFISKENIIVDRRAKPRTGINR